MRQWMAVFSATAIDKKNVGEADVTFKELESQIKNIGDQQNVKLHPRMVDSEDPNGPRVTFMVTGRGDPNSIQAAIYGLQKKFEDHGFVGARTVFDHYQDDPLSSIVRPGSGATLQEVQKAHEERGIPVTQTMGLRSQELKDHDAERDRAKHTVIDPRPPTQESFDESLRQQGREPRENVGREATKEDRERAGVKK